MEGLQGRCELILAQSVAEAVEKLAEPGMSGVCVVDPHISPTSFLLEGTGLLQQIPDGLALLDAAGQILWHNERLLELTGASGDLNRKVFFETIPSMEILGPDFGPLHSALASGETARTLLRVGEMSFLDLTATPLLEPDEEFASYLLVMLRDVTAETIHRQKLDAIYRAGLELGDLQPQDVLEMSVEDRIELLKSKILYYTQDVLEFETVEIRLVDPKTQRLKPLLSVGMDPLAEDRELYARAEGNGVTGFVAATGHSYLCENIGNDPLYLPGAPGARSSLTVPLILHDEVLGTFNVESPRLGAFDQADLQFLELFCREVAIALNTLNLLVVEKATSVTQSSLQILGDVADPVDEILNDTAWIRERHAGENGQLSERIERIMTHTRQIRELIQRAGEAMSPSLKEAGLSSEESDSALRSKRILVADADRDVRHAAHELLARYGCIVETAHDGAEALLMGRTFRYDVVISDINLPDMNGAEVFSQFRKIDPDLPVILMTGFGYDANHSLVKARQQGMRTVLYKPFRRDQLITAVLSELQVGESSPDTEST